MTSPQLKCNQKYKLIEHIATGGFGSVYKIMIHEDEKQYAVKHITLNQEEGQQSALEDAEMEYKLLKKGLPNVLKSFGSYYEPNRKFLFSTELMEMTLLKHIEEKKSLVFDEFRPIFEDILTGKK